MSGGKDGGEERNLGDEGQNGDLDLDFVELLKDLLISFFLLNFLTLSCSISTFNCGFISAHLLLVQYKTKTKQKRLRNANFKIFFANFQN